MKIQASIETYYHGTSSKLGKRILETGFDPNPKEKIWDQSKNHLESYGGTYLGNRVELAGRAGGAAVGKLGGKIWIFEVELDTDMGYPDEDDIVDIDDFVGDADGDIKKGVEYWLNDLDTTLEEYDNNLSPKLAKKLRPLLLKWANTDHAKAPKEYKQAKHEVVKLLQGMVFDLGKDNVKVLDPIGVDQITSVIEVWFEKGEVKYTVIQGNPGKFFIEDIMRFSEDEISVQKDLYFSKSVLLAALKRIVTPECER